MNRILNSHGFISEIVIENGAFFLSHEDERSIESTLSEENIGFVSIELRSTPQASLFSGIAVFINENLTSLIVGGLLMPTAYDAIKHVLKKIFNGVKNGPLRIVRADRISIPAPILKFRTKEGYIEAPIPNNFSDEQFESYIDLLSVAMKSLTEDKIDKKHLIAEFEPRLRKVVIKTIDEYGREQCEKQQRKVQELEDKKC